jgi:hypothetical protein
VGVIGGAAGRAAGWFLAAAIYAVAMAAIPGVHLANAAIALTVTCAMGYVTGALLLDPRAGPPTLSVGMVRVVAGLQLTTIAFLLSLLFFLPWFTFPAGLLVAAIVLRGRSAFAPPRLAIAPTRDGIATGLVVAVMLAPVVIAGIRMAPGEFPPVFFNVDTPYFLEKVHALVAARTFPPESLGVVDGRFAYHFGTHGMAALVARSSGLAAHHALFLLVLPLFVGGIAAAAVLLKQHLSAAVPSIVAVPLLLISIPSLWYTFWHSLGPAMWAVLSGQSAEPFAVLAGNYEFWGVASNVATNLATHFLTLAGVAGIAAAGAYGWRLPVFLVGTALLFKAPTGVALAAGFCLAQACRAVVQRNLRPLWPALGVVAVFGLVYGAFWTMAAPPTYRTAVFPLFHLQYLAEQDRLLGFSADILWLLLPALILLWVRPERRWRSLPLALAAVAPIIAVNALRAEDLRPGRGIDFDWLQVLLPVPILAHAFVLSVAGERWPRLGNGLRAAFVVAIAATVAPPIVMAARNARVLVAQPGQGHEFADNRPLARALAMIPTDDTLIVTNDLRYPANGFARNHRQLQIPALFGHQAFAVNYAYESYPFSRDRLALQTLLQGEQWTPAIDAAARMHGWTHLIVRKDYVHPAPIPLERVFDSEVYAVYRF